MNPAEFVTTHGALGAEIQNLMVKPPGFDPARSTRTSAGSRRPRAPGKTPGATAGMRKCCRERYVVLMTNFHGSTGYGQKFVEEISGDWGGRPTRT